MSERCLRAIFGGTFDPVHCGHLQAAREVREALRIDDFRFLPAGDPPHRDLTHATASQRLEMLKLALADESNASIDERELRREGPSWMSVTLASLRAEYPKDALLLVVGQDAANDLDRWHQWRQILKLAHLVVMSRPERPAEYSQTLEAELAARETRDRNKLGVTTSGRVFYCPVTPLPISSTQVRSVARHGAALRLWVPDAVADYIESEELYC